MYINNHCSNKQMKNHTDSNGKSKNQQSCRSLRFSTIAILICLITCGITPQTNAVPTDSSSYAGTLLLQRSLREVAQNEVTQTAFAKDAASTETTLDQPQAGQCLLDGVLVAETTVFCEKQVGCRAIQKTGHCCPDYKCDCEKDGKTYMNGDKLVDPETPCTVCYCQGGEILCSSVSCFHRDDCTPKYVPGVCCPAYDNCPVTTNNTQSNTPPLPKVEMPAPLPVMNPKITIKEITKPTEIRITDDNKPNIQMLKPSTTTTKTTTTTTTTSTTTTHTEKPSTAGPLTTATSRDLTTPLTLTATTTTTTTAATTKLTAINPNHLENIVENDNSKNLAGNPNLLFGTQELERVGNVAANNSSKVNIKREYLVPTEAVSNLSTLGNEYDIEPEDLTNEKSEIAQGMANPIEPEPDTAGSDNIYHIIMTTDGPRMSSTTENYLGVSTEGVSAENENANKINNYKESLTLLKLVNVTTERPAPLETSTTVASESSVVIESSTEGFNAADLTSTSTTEISMSANTEASKHATDGIHHLDDEDAAVPVESNPAYPSLPEDDFSLRDVNFPLSETDDVGEVDLKDEPRSIAASAATFDTLSSTKTVQEQSFVTQVDGSGNDVGSGSGSGNGILTDLETAPTSHSLNDLSNPIGSQTKKVDLHYSAEDTSAETAIDDKNFELGRIKKETENDTNTAGSGSGDSLEVQSTNVLAVEMSEEESGSGQMFIDDKKVVTLKKQQREHTTARPTLKPTPLVDIDELTDMASGDGKALSPDEDPKLDVESLKFYETADDNVGKSDTAAAKGSVLTVKTYPVLEKTLEEPEAVSVAELVGEIEPRERVQRLYLQRIV